MRCLLVFIMAAAARCSLPPPRQQETFVCCFAESTAQLYSAPGTMKRMLYVSMRDEQHFATHNILVKHDGKIVTCMPP